MTIYDKTDYTGIEKQYDAPNSFNFLPKPGKKNYSEDEIIFHLEIKQRRTKKKPTLIEAF